jgi:hypothetical protein
MSTRETLACLVSAGAIRQFVPEAFFTETVKRELYVVEDLYQWLYREPDGPDDADRLQFTHQRLGRFVFGDFIDNRYYMKRLHGKPHGTWEIRSSGETCPQFRVYGAFVDLDCFLGVGWSWRDKRHVGPWAQRKRMIAEAWDRLLPGVPRHTGKTFEEYVINGGHHAWSGGD